MCAPLLIAAAALTAAGAGAQMYGQSQTRRAVNKANSAEAERQRLLTNQSLGEFDKSLAYNQGVTQQGREDAASNALNQQYQQTIEQALTPAGDVGVASSAAPKAIADSYKGAMDAAKSRLQGQLAAKAKLGGFGDMLTNTQIQNANVANNQGMLGGFMKGSASVLPLELQKAQHAGDTMQNLGSLLQIAGMATGMYGSMSAASSASKLAATNANRAAMGLPSVSSNFPVGTVGPGTF